MTTTAVTPAFASEVKVTEAGGTGNSKITFEVVNSGGPEEPTIFSVYVPAVLPIKMDLEGNITVPTNTVIPNGVENKAIQVEAATVTTNGDWQHADMTTAASGSPDSHLLGLELNNQDLKSAAFPWKIEAAGSLGLNMQTEIPQQSAISADEQIATVAFTLDWADDRLNATNEIDKAKMDAALKNLTGKLTFTTSAYTGDGGIDISKNGDNSVIAVVDGQDATVYSEGGVLGFDPVVSMGDYGAMFYGYQANEMDLHGLDTSQMTSMYCMFATCENLKSINISSFDTRKVTNMYRLFFMCSNLEELDLSNFDTRCVTDMIGMFQYCDVLKSVNLNSFDTGNITNMSGMFDRCSLLESLNLSSFNTSRVTAINSMFLNCRSLTTLDLSSFDMSNLRTVSLAFYGCHNLKTCYGRTIEDCTKLNSDRDPSPHGGYVSTGKPANVNFIVKPKN